MIGILGWVVVVVLDSTIRCRDERPITSSLAPGPVVRATYRRHLNLVQSVRFPTVAVQTLITTTTSKEPAKVVLGRV